MNDAADITAFVKRKLKSGYPAGELKNELLSKGYTAAQIEVLFLQLSSKKNDAHYNKKIAHSYNNIYNVVGIALFITGIATISTQTWMKQLSIVFFAAGAICFCVAYFNATNKNENK